MSIYNDSRGDAWQDNPGSDEKCKWWKKKKHQRGGNGYRCVRVMCGLKWCRLNHETCTGWLAWERFVQGKSWRKSPEGGASAPCLGSTSKLERIHWVFYLMYKPDIRTCAGTGRGDHHDAQISQMHLWGNLGFLRPPSVNRELENVGYLKGISDERVSKDARPLLPWTILAILWYLLKLISFFSGAKGDARWDGFPSRQKVTSVRYRPDCGKLTKILMPLSRERT